MASLGDPISPRAPQQLPYIVPSNASGLLQEEEEFKSYLVDNLETFLIGHSTDTKWSDSLKEVIADTILRGRFKYHDDNTRTYRVLYHSTLTLGTPSHTEPTEPIESDSFGRKRVFCFYLAVRKALQFLSSNQVFNSGIPRLVQWIYSSQSRLEFNPSAPNLLGAVSDVIHDVITQSSRSALQTIDILITSITGVPCVLDQDLPVGTGDGHRLTKMIFTCIIDVIMIHLLRASQSKHVNPGIRWKLMHYFRLSYLQSVRQARGHHHFDLQAFYTLSKIDMCHVVAEIGIAFRAADSKICYSAPTSTTLSLAKSIAGTPASEDEHRRIEFNLTTSSDMGEAVCFLSEQDWLQMQNETKSVHQYGKWTSINREDFLRQTLADFVARDQDFVNRVATNARGDVLFYVDHIGPWRRPNDLSVRYESYEKLLHGTVQGYSRQVPARPWYWWIIWQKASKPDENGSVDAAPPSVDVRPSRFEACSYKPKTVDAVLNKPGRVLVKRKGIRGLSGRLLAAAILVLGVVSVVFNFAKRDNWLEIVFDGAQVMSLVAGLVLAIVYIINGTLTSTLDWLSGFTEVTDDIQMAQALGVRVEEIKVACTYEKTFLFWLSDVNSSFCPARKYGTIIFTEPFDMKNAERYVEFCSVIDKDHGLWLLQGWAFRIEKRGDVGRMVRVPYEDRVYVDERKLLKFE
ncbi:hypothetical protein FGB62_285g05 [Gracilaria domingensis]|nr:hypothetical protein FGB62_285g05 [Gracilaria domingensis]